MSQENSGKTLNPIIVPTDASDVHPILRFIGDNIKAISIAVGAALILAAGVSGWKMYQKHAFNKSNDELAAIMIEKNGADQVSALESLVDKAPSKLKTAVLIELAQAQIREKQPDKAAKTWEAVAATRDGKIDTAAKLGQAGALVADGKAAEAVTLLEELQKSAPDDYKQIVSYQLGVAAEAAGDANKAVAALDEAKSRMEDESVQKSLLESKIARLKRSLDNK